MKRVMEVTEATSQSAIEWHVPYDCSTGQWECMAVGCGFDSSETINPSAAFAAHVLDILATHQNTLELGTMLTEKLDRLTQHIEQIRELINHAVTVKSHDR